jgi:Ca-activated chloride channel family protein
VPGLGRDAFSVRADGVAQPITLFSGDDTPATVGLLIDNSTSMYSLRMQVISAVTAFVETSHPADDLFALTFNEQVRTVRPSPLPDLDTATALRLALQHAITARGRTAWHDAVVRGVQEVETAGQPRTALVVVSDGGDNASQHSLDDVREALATSNTVVYAVALPNPVDREATAGALQRVTQVSGGLCFTPRTAARIQDAMVAIARDIRGMYTLAYAVPAGGPGVRHVQVTVRHDGADLHARTRREYRAR